MKAIGHSASESYPKPRGTPGLHDIKNAGLNNMDIRHGNLKINHQIADPPLLNAINKAREQENANAG
jgi:hypothetical protein